MTVHPDGFANYGEFQKWAASRGVSVPAKDGPGGAIVIVGYEFVELVTELKREHFDDTPTATVILRLKPLDDWLLKEMEGSA